MFRALLGLLLLAACSNAPAQTSQAPEDSATHIYQAEYHEADRALAALKTLSSDAFEGRRTGTPGNFKAQEWIVHRLQQMDVAPYRSEGYRIPFAAGKFNAPDREVRGTNLVAKIEGERPASGPVIVISAHFDHLGTYDGNIYNGADDNASGVSALLETIAWFQDNPPDTTLLFAFFDAEEQGFGGSVSFVASLPENIRERIAFNLNLDMVARADKGELYAVGSYHNPDLVPLIDRVAEKAPITLLRGHDSPEWGDQDWSLMSDHAPFLRSGIPIIYLGVEDHADYHQPSDEFSQVNPDVFARCVDTIILMAEAVDRWIASGKD